jgi:hypothetical protein
MGGQLWISTSTHPNVCVNVPNRNTFRSQRGICWLSGDASYFSGGTRFDCRSEHRMSCQNLPTVHPYEFRDSEIILRLLNDAFKPRCSYSVEWPAYEDTGFRGMSQIPWPPRSPDITQLGLFSGTVWEWLFGYLMTFLSCIYNKASQGRTAVNYEL